MVESGSCSDGRAMLCKSLIQLSVDWWGCVPSLLFGLRPTYGRVKTTSFRRAYASTVVFRVNPCLRQRLLDTHRQVWVSLLWGHCSFLLGAGVQRFRLCPPRVCFPYLGRFCNQSPLASKVKFLGGSQSLCRIPRLEICCGP